MVYPRIDLADLVTNMVSVKKLLLILRYLSIRSLVEKCRDNIPFTDCLLCWEFRSITPLACSGDIHQIFCGTDADAPFLLFAKTEDI